MDKVKECLNGELGIQLQLAAENITTPIINESRFVPTILFNDQFDLLSWRALNNFPKAVEEAAGI